MVAIAILAQISSVAALPGFAAGYGLVLSGGRVIDPESKTDAMLNVGTRDGRVEALSAEDLTGEEVLEVNGLVVAPGFIDLHTHSPTTLGQHYQLMDGVTTALEL